FPRGQSPDCPRSEPDCSMRSPRESPAKAPKNRESLPTQIASLHHPFNRLESFSSPLRARRRPTSRDWRGANMGPQVSCPACRRRIYISESMIGRRMNCADCGTEFVAQVDPFSQPNFSGSDDFPGGGRRSGLRRRGGNSAARLALCVGAVVLLGAAGYFVYQHFFVDKHPALKAADMEALNYLPGSSQIVLGVDVGNSLTRPEFAELFKKQLARNKTLNLAEVLHNTLGLRLEDLDHVAAGFGMGGAKGGIALLRRPAGKVPETTSETLVLKTRLPYDRGRLLKKVNAGPAQQAQGKEYFRLPAGAGFSFLYLPTDRMIVLAKMKKSKLG